MAEISALRGAFAAAWPHRAATVIGAVSFSRRGDSDLSIQHVRVEYTLADRVHSVLVPLARIPDPGETITVDNGRTGVVRSVQRDAMGSEGVTLFVDIDGPNSPL